jgi:predicted DNA binding CopG/RHH family protein
MATKAISIKIDEDLLAAIKEAAAVDNLPYQTWIKFVIGKELKKLALREKRQK